MDCNNWGVALGNFDGVHIGHRMLLSKLLTTKKHLKIKTMVFTFRQHPQNVVLTANKIPLIYPSGKKEKIIKQIGIDKVEIVDFTPEFSKIEPEIFLEEYLLNRYNIEYVVVGFNYRFGKDGKGDINLLKSFGEHEGFYVEKIDPVCIEDKIVSSSLIRKLLSVGDIKAANRYLGQNYSIEGRVLRGNNRGTKMGIPTANLRLPEGILYPARGVYITITRYAGNSHFSITNVGINPTFSGNKMVVETYINEFDDDIYGKDIKVEFLDRIRDERKFENKKELKKQIEFDLKYMENYFYTQKKI